MAEVLEFAKPGPQMPSVDGFVMTESAQDMLRSLHLARASSSITLIAAAPGTGKTEVLKNFAAIQNAARIDAEGNYIFSNVFLHTAVAGEGSPWGLACQLADVWGFETPNSRRLDAARREIGKHVGPGGLLMIDEAQYLVQRNQRGKDSWDTMEWLRAEAAECGFSIAFCGDLALLEMQHLLPQLWRRVLECRPVVIKAVSRRDVEIFLNAKGMNDPEILNILFRVGRGGGGTRGCKRRLQACLPLGRGRSPGAGSYHGGT